MMSIKILLKLTTNHINLMMIDFTTNNSGVVNILGKYWNIGPNYRYTRAWMSHPKEGLVGIPAEGWQFADDDDKTKTWFDDEQLTVREIEVKECNQQIFMGVF